jgi:uroporphyrinogen-III synthase
VRLLSNKRILITRTRHQASELATQLEGLGACPVLIPTIEIVAPASYAGLDAALAEMASFDWVIFTSANAVEVFDRRRGLLAGAELATPFVTPKKIAVIGPATARAVEAVGLGVDLVPPQYVAESLAEALVPHARGARMLLVRAADARDHLPEALTAGGATVTIAEAYRNQIPPESVPALREMFRVPESYPDAITFTSASTARNLVALLEVAGLRLPSGIVLASIGPITSQALRELGYEATVESGVPSIPGLIEALVGCLGG